MVTGQAPVTLELVNSYHTSVCHMFLSCLTKRFQFRYTLRNAALHNRPKLHHEKNISMSQCDQKVCSFRLYKPNEVIIVIDQQAPAIPVVQARVTFFTTSAHDK